MRLSIHSDESAPVKLDTLCVLPLLLPSCKGYYCIERV